MFFLKEITTDSLIFDGNNLKNVSSLYLFGLSISLVRTTTKISELTRYQKRPRLALDRRPIDPGSLLDRPQIDPGSTLDRPQVVHRAIISTSSLPFTDFISTPCRPYTDPISNPTLTSALYRSYIKPISTLYIDLMSTKNQEPRTKDQTTRAAPAPGAAAAV